MRIKLREREAEWLMQFASALVAGDVQVDKEETVSPWLAMLVRAYMGAIGTIPEELEFTSTLAYVRARPELQQLLASLLYFGQTRPVEVLSMLEQWRAEHE